MGLTVPSACSLLRGQRGPNRRQAKVQSQLGGYGPSLHPGGWEGPAKAIRAQGGWEGGADSTGTRGTPQHTHRHSRLGADGPVPAPRTNQLPQRAMAEQKRQRKMSHFLSIGRGIRDMRSKRTQQGRRKPIFFFFPNLVTVSKLYIPKKLPALTEAPTPHPKPTSWAGQTAGHPQPCPHTSPTCHEPGSPRCAGCREAGKMA